MMDAGALPGPRDWIGAGEYPWPPTMSLEDGADVAACFAVHRVDVGRTRSDNAFLKLRLADSHGVVEARMWDGVDDVADALRAGLYVGVRGRIESYQNERQLRIDVLSLLQVELDDLVLFLPRSARPAAHMDAELDALIRSVRDEELRTLLQTLLGADTETGHAFRLAPAAKQNHHAYLGGLIEHTLSVAAVCDMLAQHYGASIDRDLLMAGALLHDLGKVREIGARAGFPYTDEGKLLGHIIIGMQMVADAAAGQGISHARLLLLQHLIASHQGRFEWHSPREPRTLEALLLHYADDLDAKLNQAGALVSAVPVGWTAYDRNFARDFLRHVEHDEHDEQPPLPARAPVGVERNVDAAPEAEAAPPEGGAARQEGKVPEAAQQPPAPAPPLDTMDLFEGG